MVNFPVFFTSLVASSTSPSTTSVTAFFSSLDFAAKASVMPVFGMALTDFIPFFIAFIAFMALPIAEERKEEIQVRWGMLLVF